MTSITSESHDSFPKVLVAEANRLRCESLQHALSQPPYSFVVSGAAGSAHDVVEAVERTPATVVLISASLSDGPTAGLIASREIRHRFPALRTVLIGDGHSPQSIIEAFRAGVSGIIHSDEGLETLAKCIRAVAAGEVWADSGELRALVDAVSATPWPAHLTNARGEELLSDRQRQLVDLVAAGMTNREMAEQLHLSEHTVKNYLFRIFDKLGVSSRAELIIYALNRRGT